MLDFSDARKKIQSLNLGLKLFCTAVLTIKNLVSMISNHMNVKIKIEKDNKRLRPKKSEVNILSCSSKKAQKLLKWRPQYNNEKGLKRGLAKTIDWFQNKDNLKFYKTDIYNI